MRAALKSSRSENLVRHQSVSPRRLRFGHRKPKISCGTEPSAFERKKSSATPRFQFSRSEEHTSELQSRQYLVCRLLLEKKNIEGRGGSQRERPGGRGRLGEIACAVRCGHRIPPRARRAARGD